LRDACVAQCHRSIFINRRKEPQMATKKKVAKKAAKKPAKKAAKKKAAKK
jgi:hypothetical protein